MACPMLRLERTQTNGDVRMRKWMGLLFGFATAAVATSYLSLGPEPTSDALAEKSSGDTSVTMLLRSGKDAPVVRPYVGPSASAERWDFGGELPATRP